MTVSVYKLYILHLEQDVFLWVLFKMHVVYSSQGSIIKTVYIILLYKYK